MDKNLALFYIAALCIAVSVDAQDPTVPPPSEDTYGCGECQVANDVFCVDETSYYDCMGGNTIGSLQTCEPGTVCTNDDKVCVPENDLTNAVLNVCGDPKAGDCGSCTNTKYTCVSNNQYARCSSDGKPGKVYECAADEVCVLEALELMSNICVPSCVVDYLGTTLLPALPLKVTCTNEGYTTTTEKPGATPDDTVRESVCNAATKPSSSPYFFTINTQDKTCRSYIYCEKLSTGWESAYLTCRADTYFDSETAKCVATKPKTCQ